MGIKKALGRAIFRGLYTFKPEEDLIVFQPSSPERLVRMMMVMMAGLNKIHSFLIQILEKSDVI